MRKLRVSLGMDDENSLSGKHFGDSDFFLIYDIYENGDTIFIEKRKNEHMEESVHGDFEKFKKIIKLLEDVDILVAYRMGPNFLNIKERSNKIPYITRTRNFEESLLLVKKNFQYLWNEKLKKNSEA